MIKDLLLLNLLLLLIGCSTTPLPRARCADHLVPINPPVTERRDTEHPVTGDHRGEQP